MLGRLSPKMVSHGKQALNLGSRVLLCHRELLGGDAKDVVTPCFPFHYKAILPKRIHLHEWIQLSEEDINTCFIHYTYSG